MTQPLPASDRLRYLRLDADLLEAFVALARDPHVRRYLLDGELVDAEWGRQTLSASDALFAERQVGLWLVTAKEGDPPFGFAGYHVFGEVGPEPQLLYALLEAHTGQGLATEIGGALVALARELGWERIDSAVDDPNAASLRVLEKLGFVRTGEVPGAFGPIHVLELVLA